MIKLFTYGLIPVIKDSILRIYAIVDTERKIGDAEGSEVKVKLLDDYLKEKPVRFSGLGEFQAVHAGIGYFPRSTKDKRRFEYNLVKLDPEFKIGSIDWNRKFAKSVEIPTEEKRKITFEDIKSFIDWINNENDIPKLLQEFDTVDGYIKVIESALKALTDKVVADYKFNQLVDGIKGNPVKGIISVATDGDGNPISEVDKTFSTDGNEREDQLQRAYEEGITAAKSGRVVDIDQYCPYTGEENTDLADKWKLGYQSVTKKFSTISIPDPDTRQYSHGNFIGTLADAYKFVRFFHWQTRGTAHNAFQSLYEALVDPTDSLAEKCIYANKITTFANEVFPKGDPVDYLERLKDYICESGKLLFQNRPDGSSYQSLIDDIVNAIDTCLFRIQNPDGSTRRNFSAKK